MDLSGLMSSIAYGGNGYYQGFNQAQDNNYRHSLQNLSMQEDQYDLEQKKRINQQQQQLSDDAMRLFKPSTPTPGGPQGPNQPQAGGPAQDPSQFADKFSDMANSAFARGDLAGGGQALTMATNLRAEQAAQAQKQAAMQSANLKRQVQELQYVSQAFSGTRDDPAAFEQTKLQLMSDPSISEGERQNIANFHYSPQMVDFIQQHGLTAAQQKQDQLKQLEFQDKQRHESFQEGNEQARTSLAEAQFRARQQAEINKTKAGAVKVPTANDLQNATQATKDAMGKDVDTDSDEFKNARQNIAARGLQILQQNRGMNADQAFAQAADEAKRSGEIQSVTLPEKYKTILGQRVPFTTTPATTKTTFKEKGDTRSSPIMLQPGAKDSDLVDGKYYTNSKGQVAQYKDGKFIPVQ